MPQEIPIQLEGFGGRRLCVQTASAFSGPKLLIDGAPVKKEKGQYLIRDNGGNHVEVKLKHNFIDPVPIVEVAGRAIELARPLRWYEHVWMGLPILLVFYGGGLGAMCGYVAVCVNARIFRRELNPITTYLVTGLISVGSVAVFIVLATLIFSLFPGLSRKS